MKTIRKFRRALLRRASRHGESGQALAEIAIALPLLLLMLIGIWEFARAYQIQQVVVNAAREGAREVVLPEREVNGVMHGTQARAEQVVRNYLAAGSIPCNADCTITFTSDQPLPHNSGHAITVDVQVPYTFNLIGPLIRLATGNDGGPGDITLRSRATMRHE